MVSNDDSNDVSVDENIDPCTYAVTGKHPMFQPIYICITCNKKYSTKNVCICEGCAFMCHDAKNHEIEFIGVGESYCDCLTQWDACCLYEYSNQLARKMCIPVYNGNGNVNVNVNYDNEVAFKHMDESQTNFPYVVENNVIPALMNSNDGRNVDCDRFIDQAMELIQHTKETHWISSSTDTISNKNEMCGLEKLALKLFEYHVKSFHLEDTLNHYESNNENSISGAEWWVQVKSIPTLLSLSKDDDTLKDTSIEKKRTGIMRTNEEVGVDLHYDKDENLADAFGLGSFPTLSTVTYFTDNALSSPSSSSSSSSSSMNQAPTLIFPHTYNEGEDSIIDKVIVSHPKKGKHIVFDGRLLHGAPAHPSLRQPNGNDNGSKIKNGHDDAQKQINTSHQNHNQDQIHNQNQNTYRVTFLVNIWIGNKPSGVNVLESTIRNQIMEKTNNNIEFLMNDINSKDSWMMKEDIGYHFVSQNDMNVETIASIQLPFVSNTTEMNSKHDENEIDDEQSIASNYEEESELIVCMTPFPPLNKFDTVHYHFDHGLESYLKRL